MTKINNNYNYYNNYYQTQAPNNTESDKRYYYKQKSPEAAELGWFLATTASGLIYSLLPSFSNPFLKQMTKEHQNNHIYQDVFQRAYENSELREKGLNIIHESNPTSDVGKGLNAYFNPSDKTIVLNTQKASISGFHELGHAMNNMQSKFGKFLQKLRKPGYTIAGLMGTLALVSRNKPKDEQKNIGDYILDNSHKIAFAAMLPTVLEEFLASYKGIEAARAAGLGKAHIKNLEKFYGKALLSYGGYAFVTGLAVYAANKITEQFTRPKKIEY